MRQSQQPDPSSQRCDVKTQILDRVVSYVLEHHDWCNPLVAPRYWEHAFPNCSNQRIRALVLQHAEEGCVIKAITRELPDSLKLRPPSWLDLSKRSLFADATHEDSPQATSCSNSVGHFLPSPSYLTSLPPSRFESAEHYSWILGEAQRVWQELQREDTRALVRTNVPNEVAAVIESLTTTLFAQLKMYPTINRRDALAAVSVVAKRMGLLLPLEDGDQEALLRGAKEYLLRDRDGHVRNHFQQLSRPGWRF